LLIDELANIALAEKSGRMEWSVLKWNQSAIKFYENIGAVAMNEWIVYRMNEDDISVLVKKNKT
jgi:hypothetical protein